MKKIKPIYCIEKDYKINKFIYFNKLNVLCASQKTQLINVYKFCNIKKIIQKKSLFFYLFLYAKFFSCKKKLLGNNYNIMLLKNKPVYFISGTLSQSLINIIFLYYKGRLSL